MLINQGVRKYRKGPDVRIGNISEKDFKKEFRVKDIIYSNKYLEEEKQKMLNYAYDSFHDLSFVLQCPTEFITLRSESGYKNSVTFGEAVKGNKNLVISKDGHIAVNWFAFFDRYLGNQLGVSDGLLKNINMLDDSELVNVFKQLLQQLKKKKKEVNEEDFKKISLYKQKLDDLLEELPFQTNRNIEEVMNIEDSISRFLKDLTMEKLLLMFQTFKTYNIEIGDLKDKILNAFENIENERTKLERESNSVLIDTDYYTQMKTLYSEDSLNSYLVYIGFENYVKLKLKEDDRLNNILVGLGESKGIEFNPSEQYVFYNAFNNLLSIIIPSLVDSICMTDDIDEDLDVDEVSEKERIIQIDSALESDRGKFKLTYFKELAKNNGYVLDDDINDRGIGGCYYIKMTKGVIGYVRIPVYNHPKDRNHVIIVYRDDNTEIDRYTWDGAVKYNNLINFLNKIEEKNKKPAEESVVDSKRDELQERKKFRLHDFKQLCVKNKLNVDLGATPEKDYKYIIKFKNSYISYVIVPIEYNIKNGINDVVIKTVTKTLTYNWKGILSDDVLIKLVDYLVHIELNGLPKLKELVKKTVDEIGNERVNLKRLDYDLRLEKNSKNNRTHLESLCGMERKLSDSIDSIKETKDLREFFRNYTEEYSKRNKLLKCNTLDEILQNLMVKNSPYVITFIGKLAKQEPQGHSKNWILDGNTIYIIDSSNYIKAQEGIIESIVTAYISDYLKDKRVSKKYMNTIIEGVVYMLCRLYKLDVRTYCTDSNFVRLVGMSKAEKEKYIKKVLGFFKNLVVYFIKVV